MNTGHWLHDTDELCVVCTQSKRDNRRARRETRAIRRRRAVEAYAIVAAIVIVLGTLNGLLWVKP